MTHRPPDPVRLGAVGLGRGFMLTLPSILADPHVRLVAVAARRAAQRDAFVAGYGGRAHDSVEALAADPGVEAVYIATPHELHADHAEILGAAGKHLLIDKPLAVSLEDADRIVAAARQHGVTLITGPSHSFDGPVLAARKIIDSGEFGPVRMLHAFNYTDFLYRPRRPEELVTDAGGGVVFSQAVHQIDMVRLLVGQPALTVTAHTGAWDPARPTEGAYAALVTFAGGAFASLVYSGYGHFDSDEWQGWLGELGTPKDPGRYGTARDALSGTDGPEAEAALKRARGFGAAAPDRPADHHEHFGPIVVSCERGDLRITPQGLWIYGAEARRFVAVAPDPAPRSPVFAALHAAIRKDTPPLQSGAWGLASLELCHAILASSATGAPVQLHRQTLPDRQKNPSRSKATQCPT